MIGFFPTNPADCTYSKNRFFTDCDIDFPLLYDMQANISPDNPYFKGR